MLQKVKLLSIMAVVLCAGGAWAANIYTAVLLPGAVVPPSSESAYGSATFIVAENGVQVGYTLNFAGLEGAQTAAFLMNAAEGVNGPTLMNLPLGTPIAGTFDLTPEMAAALTDGHLAIQINSADWPDGVLRGNFAWVTVPTEAQTWSAVKALFE